MALDPPLGARKQEPLLMGRQQHVKMPRRQQMLDKAEETGRKVRNRGQRWNLRTKREYRARHHNDGSQTST